MNLETLQQIASSENMIPSAPILATRSVKIHAPSAAVWQTQTNVSRWHEWYSYPKNAHLEVAFEPGAKLTYGGLFKHNLRIATVRDQQLVVVYGTYMGFSGITQWAFKPLSPSETEVTFSESSAGFMMATLYSNEKLEEHLDHWLQHLKARAESRQGQIL